MFITHASYAEWQQWLLDAVGFSQRFRRSVGQGIRALVACHWRVMACPNTLSHCPSQKTWSASMRPTCSPQLSGSSCYWYYSLARSAETVGAFKGFKVIVGSGSMLTWVKHGQTKLCHGSLDVLSVWPSHYLYMTLLREFMLWSAVQRNLCPVKSDWDQDHGWVCWRAHTMNTQILTLAQKYNSPGLRPDRCYKRSQ
jgi:hypothetical protein